MKYCFIINPRAGKGMSTEELVERITDACEAKGAEYETFVSPEAEGTAEFILNFSQALAEDERVTYIACGGDGTLCKTATAVMSLPDKLRERAAIGVMPMGTGNDFVSNFENKELFSSIEAQLDPTPFEVDVMRCNDVYSMNMVNIGFDCHVVCKKEQIGKRAWVPRKLAYIISLMITLVKKPGVTMGIALDGGEQVKNKFLLTTFANGCFCGGGFKSNPTASLTDGAIDCLKVKNIGRIKFVSLVGDYKKGLHLGDKFKKIIEHIKSNRVDMYFDEETPISVDGEILYVRELHITVAGRALTFMLPCGVTPKEMAAIPEASAV